MFSLPEVLHRIEQAFPIFSHGQRHIEEFLDGYSFDDEGIRQRWEMFDLLSANVLTFLSREYPQLGARARSACRDLAVSALREQIARIARTHRCYASILASLSDSDLTLQSSADVCSGDIEHIMKFAVHDAEAALVKPRG